MKGKTHKAEEVGPEVPSVRCQPDLPEQVWMERACHGASPEGDLGRDLLPGSLILVPPPLLQLSQWSWGLSQLLHKVRDGVAWLPGQCLSWLRPCLGKKLLPLPETPCGELNFLRLPA